MDFSENGVPLNSKDSSAIMLGIPWYPPFSDTPQCLASQCSKMFQQHPIQKLEIDCVVKVCVTSPSQEDQPSLSMYISISIFYIQIERERETAYSCVSFFVGLDGQTANPRKTATRMFQKPSPNIDPLPLPARILKSS